MKLSEISKHKIHPAACFKAPEGYFEQMTKQVMQRIETGAPAPAPPVSGGRKLYLHYRRWCVGITAAACLAFALLLDRAVEDISQQPQGATAAPGKWDATGEDLAEADEIYDYLMLDENKLCDYAEYEE